MIYLDFIDWVRKNSIMVEVTDKRSKKKYNLERWLVDDNGVHKEIIKKVEIESKREDNPTKHSLNYCCVPNIVTDTPKEVYMYETFGRKVLGRHGHRNEVNLELLRRKKLDIVKRRKLLKMIKDNNLILYRKYLIIKYRQYFKPSIAFLRQWQRIPEHIKIQVNQLIQNYNYAEEEE